MISAEEIRKIIMQTKPQMKTKQNSIKCKDCYWYSNVLNIKCCERDGSDPCDPEYSACSLFEPKDEEE